MDVLADAFEGEGLSRLISRKCFACSDLCSNI